jgi:hypothetical protein
MNMYQNNILLWILLLQEIFFHLQKEQTDKNNK